MSYKSRRAIHGATPAPSNGRGGPAYAAAVAQVKARARDGEPCCFCGEGFDWGLHHNQAGAFTAHHGDRLMEGGAVVPHPSRMFPAHRGCNSGDGLRAQNRRRAQAKAITECNTEPHSREW